MTHIRGEIFKIFEVDRDAYTQIIPGANQIIAYSFGGNVPGLTTVYFDLSTIGPSLLHSINVSANAVNFERIYIILYPAGTVLFDAYFLYDSQKQFFLGDIPVDPLNLGGYIRVHLQNLVAGIRWIGGSLWYIDI